MHKPPSYVIYPFNTMQIYNSFTLNKSLYETLPSVEPTELSFQKKTQIDSNSVDSIDNLTNSNSTAVEMSLNCNENALSLNKVMKTLTTINDTTNTDVISVMNIKRNKCDKVVYENKNKNDKALYKVIHHCSYPGCNRKFTSSGWLKAHFGEHLNEIKKKRFNVLFDKLIHGY